MNWEDECYLLSKRKFRENASIINVLTLNKGKIAGIVYGGNSRKIRNYLQVSNKLFVFNSSKNENKIGYFKTELIKAISPNYFNNKEKTSALISLCSLLNSLLPESQPYKNIYKSFDKFINSLNLVNWIILYIFFGIMYGALSLVITSGNLAGCAVARIIPVKFSILFSEMYLSNAL